MASQYWRVATRIYDAKYWRALAQQLRAEAETLRDPVSKQMMLRIAEDYEQLAEGQGSDSACPNG